MKTLQGKPANQNNDEDDVDDLIDEGRGGKKRQQQQQQQQQVDYDKMSPSQLVNVMRQEFGAGFAEIKTAIHAIRIERDIEAIMEDEKNSDFELYAEDIVAMMQERPNLKVHEAYVLAKNKDPKRSETKKANDEEQGNRRQRFLGGLPDPRRKSHGERPGAAGSTTGPGTAKTVDDAAERAYEEIFKGKSPNE